MCTDVCTDTDNIPGVSSIILFYGGSRTRSSAARIARCGRRGLTRRAPHARPHPKARDGAFSDARHPVPCRLASCALTHRHPHFLENGGGDSPLLLPACLLPLCIADVRGQPMNFAIQAEFGVAGDGVIVSEQLYVAAWKRYYLHTLLTIFLRVRRRGTRGALTGHTLRTMIPTYSDIAHALERRFSTTPHSLVVSSVSWCMMGRLPCEMSVCASACARGARLRRGWLRWMSARKARMGV